MTMLRIFSTLVAKLLPNQIKRMIFLSSLAAFLRDLNQPDIETLKKINSIMALSHDVSALELPMRAHMKIWGDFDVEKLRIEGIQCDSMRDFSMEGMRKSQMRIVANRLIDAAPTWLYYQSREDTRKDIYSLFTSLDMVMGATCETTQAISA